LANYLFFVYRVFLTCDQTVSINTEANMASLADMIGARDVAGIKAFMEANGLRVDGNHIVPADEAVKQKFKQQSEFWDQRQLAR
jgi:hypothetical protein